MKDCGPSPTIAWERGAFGSGFGEARRGEGTDGGLAAACSDHGVLELQGVLVRQLTAAVLLDDGSVLFTASVQESNRAELDSLKELIAAAKIS